MNKQILKYLFLCVLLAGFGNIAVAQKKGKKPVRKATTRKNTKTKTKANIKATTASVDTVAIVAAPAVVVDTLPIKKVLKSLRRDETVSGGDAIRDRIPLIYEDLRADDAVYRHKVWREIDTREKLNLPFRYSADQDNGNQRFISILLQAIQDSAVTVFSNVDDRFTTPLTKGEVAKVVSGEEITFDKESSRLFFRVLGIAPVKDIITTGGINLGPSILFWVYYPDMRPTFAKYEVYNGKNFGARMSWEELFESRMFYGRIIKSTIDNPYDLEIRNYKGLSENKILQLLEGESIKEKIFNYEQDLWSY